MTSRVSSKNEEGKIVLKKRDQTKKKNHTKKQKTASPGVEPGLSAHSKQHLDHCATVTHVSSKSNFVISKQFFSAIDAV